MMDKRSIVRTCANSLYLTILALTLIKQQTHSDDSGTYTLGYNSQIRIRYGLQRTPTP